ncbi:MAG: Alanine dehydrogenase [Smithella sp. PtaU1.Bin162]|nr:MAG: Alanine dehydrogenase [Smithella sp. PtaU1.Bin162]
MIVGILKEIKNEEYRVAMTPAGVEVMKFNGHKVFVETNAGRGSGFENDAYLQAGAEILETSDEIYKCADMVMHVKEPLPVEYKKIRKDQIVFTYLHLAASESLTEAMVDSGSIGIAYETIQKKDGSLPLLIPMSEVAGRMSIQEGARYLEMSYGGKGMLLGGVPGVEPAIVLIIGAGTVGTQAAKMACGLGAKVYIVDSCLARLRQLDDIMPKNCITLMSSPENIRRLIKEADLVIGSVLIPGAKAPKLVTSDMVKTMKKGSVMVDVAIDQGGCFETSKVTTHQNPVFVVDDVIHYCVGNMPGAVAKTSTLALTNATLPYAVEIANKGWKRSMRENEEIRKGANVVEGKITFKAVAEAFGMDLWPVSDVIQ